MVIWLTRVEKVEQHAVHVRWREAKKTPTKAPEPPLRLQLTKIPSVPAAPLSILQTDYHATTFAVALQAHLKSLAPHVSSSHYSIFTALVNALETQRIALPVWHRIRIVNPAIQEIEGIADYTDSVTAAPARKTKFKTLMPERFDTVLVDRKGDAEESGIGGTRMVSGAMGTC